MKQEKIKQVKQYFTQQIALCKDRRRELAADDRPDEASFAQVRANIYQIFCTILSVAEKQHGEDLEKIEAFFQAKLEEIPAYWKAAFAEAEAQEDPIRMHIERIKLDTAAEIREAFSTIWRDTK